MSGYSLDDPSSPDPLNDDFMPTSAVPPSTRRVIRSHASNRYASQPGTSPRKRIFALNVGDETAPQNILVTVEAEPSSADRRMSGVSRRLFGSPTRQPMTTTTTVPLRGLTDDEGGPTPRRRRRSSGRPGTPAGASAKKRRGTPNQKSAARKPRGTPVASSDNLRSDISEATPKARRGRPPKRKEPPAASEQDEQNAGPPPRKRGRPRKTLDPDEAVRLVEAGSNDDNQSIGNGPLMTSDAPEEFVSEANGAGEEDHREGEEEEDVWMAQLSDPPIPGRRSVPEANIDDDGPTPAEGEEEEDIWLAQLSDPSTRGSRISQRDGSRLEASAARHEEERNAPSADLDEPQYDAADDYAPMMEFDDRSDVESHVSGQTGEDGPDVDPESFTMIDMESMPSMQASYRQPESELSEMGETTNMIINNTLESLRQSMAERGEEEEDVDLVEEGEKTPVHGSPSRSTRATTSPRRTMATVSPAEQRPTASPSATRTTVSPRRNRATASPSATASSKGRKDTPLSSADTSLQHWSRSPRRKGQLLSRQVALKTLQQDNQPSRATGQREVSAQIDSSRAHAEDADAYEDSFSEIPEEVLEAATPKRVHGSLQQFESEQDLDAEMDMYVEADRNMDTNKEMQHTSPRYPDLPQTNNEDDNQTNDGEHFQESSSSGPEYSHSKSNQGLERNSSSPTRRSETEMVQEEKRISSSPSIQSQTEMIRDVQQNSPSPTRSLQPQITAVQDAEQVSLSHSVQPHAGSNQDIEQTSPAYSVRSHAESNRLLTPPDESSTPTNGATPDKQKSVVSEIRSSPPEFADSQLERSIPRSRQNSDTPAIHLYPSLPLTQEQLAQNASLLPDLSGARPGLSPIVRIGRTLQDIMSDPPSPSAHSSVLGSPFRGSARNSSPPAEEDPAQKEVSQPSAPILETAQPAARPWSTAFAPLSQLKNLVAQGAQALSSPRVNTATPSLAKGLDDPFGPATADDKRPVSSGSAKFMDRVTQASRQGSRSGSVRSPARSETQNEDAMNWTAAEVAIPEDYAESESSSVRGTAGSKSFEQDMEAEEYLDQEPEKDLEQEPAYELEDDQEPEQSEYEAESEQAEEEFEDDEEEEDIWAIEAQRTHSLSPEVGHTRAETFIPGRRTGLPAAWRNQDATGTRSPMKSRPVITQQQSDHMDEYSLAGSSKPAEKKAAAEPGIPKRVDLSNFFSSSSPIFSRRGKASQAPPAQPPAQDLSVNHATVSSSRTAEVQNRLLSVPQNAFVPGNKKKTDLFSPVRVPTGDTTEEAETSPPGTPEQPVFDHIPQKRNFTPLRGQGGRSLFSQGAAPAVSFSPVKQAQTLERPHTPDDVQESSFEGPVLKPLPDKTASPPKSCIRSPLKPKTPGRVVEFTSSTLSPLTEAQARAQDRSQLALAASTTALSQTSTLSGTTATSDTNVLSQASALSQRRNGSTSGAQETIYGGQENQGPANQQQSLTAAPPPRNRHSVPHQQQQKQAAATNNSPLSQTQWHRKHWLLLDGLLQSYRRAPLEFQLKYISSIRTSPSKRPSRALLGKQVESLGEAMILEQWHLDVVDAFKKKVGGWAEDVLAKRLFALIVGEERRRAGQVPRSRK